MQTVVLAAGQGTRLRPLTDERPKPIVPVVDRPLIVHAMRAAAEAGASRFVVVVGYGAEQVRETVGASIAGVPVEFVDQGEPRGTAHAVGAARSALEEAPFVVLNGDSIYDPAGLETLYGESAAVASYRVDHPERYGVLSIEGGRITGVLEKPDEPPSDLINAGAYVFPAASLEFLDVPESDRGEHELTDVLERTIETVDVRPVPLETWLDVGYPWDLLAAMDWRLHSMDHRIEGTVHPDANLDADVTVADGARIESGVVLEGPAYVGPGASVGPNAYLRGPVSLGPGASVGHAVEVKASVFLEDAAANHLSYVGDSVLGRDVNLGAGTQVANLRHDGEPVRVTVKGERVSTGRRKFGVVCGRGAKTGINTSLNAGVVLSPGASTTPGESVLRDR